MEAYLVAHGERSAPNGQELLAEFVQYGHQKPFEEIVRRYAGMVFNVCVRITKDKHEAEDATQAVFLTLALQAKRGTEIKALGPWLQQVAKRLSLDSRRSKKRRKTREERHQEEQTLRRESILGDTLPEADLDELKTVLHEELQKLPTKYRLPLILHYFGGLSRDEMAAELGCKPSTLGVRIFRGREMLAGRLSGRGINISAGALAIALGFAVKRAISDSLISSTSYAATALAAGHDGAGLASAHVIGLTRRASSALIIGKVKVAALTLMIAGTSLGASVKAMDMIPAIDVRQMISNQVQRLVRPLFAPFNQPMHVDARPVVPSANTTASAASFKVPFYQPMTTPQPAPVPVAAVKAATAVDIASSLKIITPDSQLPSILRMPWADPVGRSDDDGTILPLASDDRGPTATPVKSGDVADAYIDGAAGGGIGGSGSSSDMSGSHRSDSTVSHASSPSLSVPLVIATANNLVIPPALGKTGKSTSNKTSSDAGSDSTTAISTGTSDLLGTTSTTTTSAATTASPSGTHASTSTPTTTSNPGTPTSSPMSPTAPTQIIQIPAIDGSVIASNGTIRGYGIVNRTGTIDINGMVVADGSGVDRTLNLKSITGIQQDISNAAAGGENGWYAVDHGRLSLPLLASPTPNTFTWGENPNDAKLDLVNSVRLSLQTSGSDFTSLSLLSPDRDDIPNLSGLGGAPVGLWQVDPTDGSISAADLTIRYNDTLIAQLGASESSVNLWELCSATDSWTPVDPSTFSLDMTDHLVSGDATDFSYFAVTVPPAADVNAGYLVANPQSQISPGQISVVPEPASMIWLAVGGALLSRRRRRFTEKGRRPK